ncbi:MAG: metal-sensitive transcriptional regulator [Alphaproteobacteria bacterium]|nr:metal-sensitive transcriptional regulator [Alphaproteobacteria bacterium]MBR5130901.1 metal-sensitive transcriptional regulator [Alphaproteobacteria bacterium]
MKGNKIKIQENTLAYMENMPRLSRISGQINGIKKMIDEGRSCSDILVQLRAVNSAIKAVESNLLFAYINQVILQTDKSEKDRQAVVDNMKTLFDRFRG